MTWSTSYLGKQVRAPISPAFIIINLMTLRSINCRVVTQPLDSLAVMTIWHPPCGVWDTLLAVESTYLVYLYCYEAYRVLLVSPCKSCVNFIECRCIFPSNQVCSYDICHTYSWVLSVSSAYLDLSLRTFIGKDYMPIFFFFYLNSYPGTIKLPVYSLLFFCSQLCTL